MAELPNMLPVPKTGATAPPVKPTSTKSTPSLYDQALAQAQAALQAQIDPLNTQIKSNDANTAQRVSDAISNAQALSDMLKQIAPAIQGVYSNAAQDQGILGKGFSQATQASLDQNAAGIDKTLAGIGAPAGQNIDPSQSGKVADVLYGLGGFIPGQTFAQKGAAYAGAAAMLPATALLSGAQNAQQARMAGEGIDAGLQNKIAELAGKLPGDVQTNYQNLQKMALDNKKFAEDLRHNKVSEGQAAARLKLDAAKYNTSIDEFNITSARAQQRLQLDANKFARTQFQQDRTYAVSLQRLGISQKNLQLRIAAAAYTQAHGGYSAKDVARFNSKLDALQASGDPVHTANGIYPGPQTDKSGKKIPYNTYASFIKAALQKGIPVQLAIDRANSIWPETERGNLGSLADLPAVAAAAAQTQSDHAITTGQAPSVASSPAVRSLQNYAFSKFSGLGWSKQDAAALQQLWNGESGWNPNAYNKSSGAAGIPQALGHTLPADYRTNPKSQINWGLKYIKGRYGSPSRAWAFWQATVNKDASYAPPDLRATAEYWIAHGYGGY